MTTTEPRAAVIGCGIGGATTALALAAINVPCDVYEATTRTVDHPGWVTLGPTAMTSLDQIGLAKAVREIGFPVDRVQAIDTTTGDVREFSRFQTTHHWCSTHVWRRDLLRLLRDRLHTLGINCSYGHARTLGDLDDADLIVGADGAWSATRCALGNSTKPSYTGQIIVYGHHPHPATELPTHVLHFWRHPTGVVGYVGDTTDGSFWFSRYDAPTPNDTTDHETATAALRRTPVQDVLDTSQTSPHVALYELDPTGTWHDRRTILLGDAAHAVSPSAGRGATSAIEDAITLARCLHNTTGTGSIHTALKSFNAIRRPIAEATYRPIPGHQPPTITASQLRLPARQ